MANSTSITFIVVFCMTSFLSFAQNKDKKEMAKELGNEAVFLMKKDESNQAIKLLKKARKLDPTNYVYTYEIAVAHYINSDYAEGIEEAKLLLSHRNVTDECYQLLGVLYSISGDSKNALKAFDEGLARFPDSGSLYAEQGVVYLEGKNKEKAKSSWEKGMEIAPNFPNNYYFLTGYYAHLEEHEQVIVLGEIYRNLDQNSERSHEISHMIYEAYQDLYISNNFSSDTKELAADSKVNFDLQMLLSIRKNIFEETCKSDNKTKYLLEHHNNLQERNLIEPYEYWLFMEGDTAGFASWYEKNEQKFKSLSFWLLSNKLRFN